MLTADLIYYTQCQRLFANHHVFADKAKTSESEERWKEDLLNKVNTNLQSSIIHREGKGPWHIWVPWCAVIEQLRKYFYGTGTKHSPSLTLHSSPMHFLKTSRLRCEHCSLLVYIQHNMADTGFSKLQATKRNLPCLGVATTCSGKAGKHRQAQQHIPKVKQHCQCWTDGRKEGWKSHPCYKCLTWHRQLIAELQGILERQTLFLRKLEAKKWRYHS